jgi:hypothetical protein
VGETCGCEIAVVGFEVQVGVAGYSEGGNGCIAGEIPRTRMGEGKSPLKVIGYV